MIIAHTLAEFPQSVRVLSIMITMSTVPFRFGGGQCLPLRRMTASERAAWCPPVGIDPPVASVRSSQAHKRVFGSRVKFETDIEPLPHAEFFKMYFGWLGSAEVNFGKNRDEFDVAHRALLHTIDAIGIDGDLHAACETMHDDLCTIADLRGPRDYVYTVRDDTGRMWLEIAQGVYVCELMEIPSPVGAFQFTFNDSGVTAPRQCSYLFRRGELLGTSAVSIPLATTLVERFLALRVLCECHVEVGDDDEPFAVFLSLARVTLKDQKRFETERLAAFRSFPLEGISRVKNRPWSLYELFAEMVIARMLITQNDAERAGERCAHFSHSWLRQHMDNYSRDVGDGKTHFERLPDFVSVHDLHSFLGHATAPNRHIGAAVLAVFRGAMRSMFAAALPGLKCANTISGGMNAGKNELLQILNGVCRLSSRRSWTEAGLTTTGVTVGIGAAISSWHQQEQFMSVVLASAVLSLGFFVWTAALKARHDCGASDWIAGRRTVSCISEIKRELGEDWRKVLAEPLAASKLASGNGCIFSPHVGGPVVVVDEPITVGDVESVGYELGVEDSGHVGLRPPFGDFRRVELSDDGLHLTKEKCTGRMWTFNARNSQLALCSLDSPPEQNSCTSCICICCNR